MNIEQLYNLYSQYPVISTDSRKVAPGSIYFALKGDSFDGNTFAAEAIHKGACYAVIDNKEYHTDKCILVENVLETLQKLARFHRRSIKISILAITGTNGKTTTKELIHSVLLKKYSVQSTHGNLNNQIGVPLTLLSMTNKTEIGVVEMGANHPHEIESLCNIAEPDYGIITNIGKAHLEGFGGYQGVINAKNELYQYLINNNGLIFYNSDNPVLSSLLINYSNKVSYGLKSGKNCSGKIETDDSYLTIEVNKITDSQPVESCKINSHLFGEYNAENILAACSVGFFFNVSLQEIQKAISSYTPNNNRSQIKETRTNKLILDCYNSNPSSCETAIKNFISLNGNNKTIILGDMFELGKYAEEEHKKILDLVVSHRECKVYLVGNCFKSLADEYNITAFSNTNDLKTWLTDYPIINQVILIKGSRGNRLESIIDLL
jgi:UDP-N-acetylmuramoyl-tripeptide--D-alanyl-D-alanine ligase